MDVAILAGGYATRLHGIWDGPKCLVPVAGEPLLKRLLIKTALINPGKITLLLGHNSIAIIRWLKKEFPSLEHNVLVENSPKGTAVVLRKFYTDLNTPLLVLNGDTLPLYDLHHVTHAHQRLGPVRAVVGETNAGAYTFNAKTFSILYHETPRLIDECPVMGRLHSLEVDGFLDVGTRDGFERAQNIGDNEL